jgi:molybdate transport system ATP-binding protein
MLKINVTKKLLHSQRHMSLDINLSIKQGSLVALTGISGSGKTTLLRILAGVESAKGDISFKNEIWLKDDFVLAPQKRQIGFVFQDYALFPNMSVLQNLLFVNDDKKLAQYLLDITKLSDIKNRSVVALSGGQKQRVSLCRAMMNKPKLLLLDEPLSALDLKMRTTLQDEILILHKEFNTTTILVSHDFSEIYKLSHSVIVLDDGKIINNGICRDILLKTANISNLILEGQLLDIIKQDTKSTAIVSIGQQILEVALSDEKVSQLKIGDNVKINTKNSIIV